MATTHALAGVVLGSAALRVAPEFAPVALAAAVVGSVFPDFDLYAGHRKTLHFPVYYAALAVPVAALAVALPRATTVALALFVVGAALHSLMDAFGGGLELEPWRATSDRAVYDHFRGRWVAPRRWIRYDGSPEDLALAAVFAAPAIVVHEAPVRELVVGVLAVSAGYAVFRKPLARVWGQLASTVPHSVENYVPERFHEANEGEIAGGRSDAD